MVECLLNQKRKPVKKRTGFLNLKSSPRWLNIELFDGGFVKNPNRMITEEIQYQ